MPPTEPELAALPVSKGFRLRGTNMTRIETFTDAAFAFAVTLLVVSLEVPQAFTELREALIGAPAFAASFAILMQFWATHWRFSRRYGLEDALTIFYSCLLVFIILVYVVPLKFLMKGFQDWATNLLFGVTSANPVQINAAQLAELFVVYGAGFAVVCLLLAAMYHHALALREELALNDLERFDTVTEIQSLLLTACVAGASMLTAILLPMTRYALPGLVYFSLAIVLPWHGTHRQRGRNRRFGPQPGL
ncbi:MAG: TMEM175 family protein [Phycisphaerales bacterium JB037]